MNKTETDEDDKWTQIKKKQEEAEDLVASLYPWSPGVQDLVRLITEEDLSVSENGWYPENRSAF